MLTGFQRSFLSRITNLAPVLLMVGSLGLLWSGSAAAELPNESGRVILCDNPCFHLVGEVGKEVKLSGKVTPETADGAKQRRYQWRQCLEGDVVESLTSFECPKDWAEDYGTWVHGYLYPPVTGNYTFWIASDDEGELWLSPDPDPKHEQEIAFVNGWTPPRAWDSMPSQRSRALPLQAGKAYYIEALQKEGGGGDHLSVAWACAGHDREVIPGQYLSELPLEQGGKLGTIRREVWKYITGGTVADLQLAVRSRKVDLRDADKPVAAFTPDSPGYRKFELMLSQGDRVVSTERVSVFVSDTLKNGDFESGEGDRPAGWQTSASDASAVRFAWERTGGIGGSRCLSISLMDTGKPVEASWSQTLRLTPYTSYLLRGYLKVERLRTTAKMAAMLQFWGTEAGPGASVSDSDWMPFEARQATGATGEITVRCRLGRGGAVTSGKVYFDNLTVEGRTDVESFEGHHFILHMPNALTSSCGRAAVENMVAKVDRVCEAMADLTGNDEGGDKQSAQWVKGFSGGVSGNPLGWGEYLHSIQHEWPKDDFCAEIFLHELGHDYTHGGEFNAEFAMYYALETCNLAIAEDGYTKGAETRHRWKARTNRPGSGCDLLYRFILLRDKIGWEPYKKLYRCIRFLPGNERPPDIWSQPASAGWRGLNFWVNTLSEYSGFDCWSVFSDLERGPGGFIVPEPSERSPPIAAACTW